MVKPVLPPDRANYRRGNLIIRSGAVRCVHYTTQAAFFTASEHSTDLTARTC
jgi:hypothetical protein